MAIRTTMVATIWTLSRKHLRDCEQASPQDATSTSHKPPPSLYVTPPPPPASPRVRVGGMVIQ